MGFVSPRVFICDKDKRKYMNLERLTFLQVTTNPISTGIINPI